MCPAAQQLCSLEMWSKIFKAGPSLRERPETTSERRNSRRVRPSISSFKKTDACGWKPSFSKYVATSSQVQFLESTQNDEPRSRDEAAIGSSRAVFEFGARPCAAREVGGVGLIEATSSLLSANTGSFN